MRCRSNNDKTTDFQRPAVPLPAARSRHQARSVPRLKSRTHPSVSRGRPAPVHNENRKNARRNRINLQRLPKQSAIETDSSAKRYFHLCRAGARTCRHYQRRLKRGRQPKETTLNTATRPIRGSRTNTPAEEQTPHPHRAGSPTLQSCPPDPRFRPCQQAHASKKKFDHLARSYG